MLKEGEAAVLDVYDNGGWYLLQAVLLTPSLTPMLIRSITRVEHDHPGLVLRTSAHSSGGLR